MSELELVISALADSLSCICICALQPHLLINCFCVTIMTHKVLMKVKSEKMEKGIFIALTELMKTHICGLKGHSPDFTHERQFNWKHFMMMSSVALEELSEVWKATLLMSSELSHFVTRWFVTCAKTSMETAWKRAGTLKNTWQVIGWTICLWQASFKSSDQWNIWFSIKAKLFCHWRNRNDPMVASMLTCLGATIVVVHHRMLIGPNDSKGIKTLYKTCT